MSRSGVLAGLRARVPAMLVAVLTLASPLGAVPSAQAATLQALSLSAPLTAETRIAFALSGYGAPVKAGRPVVVQRLSGTSWVEVARTTESSTGRYAVSTSVTSAGKLTYRAVASSWLGAPAVASVSRVVAVHLPYVLLTPPTAIVAETVRATGTLPGVYSRPVWVQRRYGASWLTMVKTTTTTRGAYSTSFRAPAVASYAVRSLAPRVTIAGKVRAQYVTAAKTLKVVAQSASISLPTTLVQPGTGVATLSFAPARAGRGVAVQVLRAGVWTPLASSSQSSAGSRSFTITAGTPGSYSYRGWTAAAAGAPAFVSPAKILKVTPPPVTGVTATSNSSTSLTLSWANPAVVSVTGVRIRRAVGSAAPTSPTAGTQVVDVSKPVTTYTNTGLVPGTKYSYALFAHTGTATWLYATAATAAATTVPGPVTALTAVPASTSVALSWANPTGASLTGVMIRRLPGATAPASSTAGELVSDALGTAFTDTSLTPTTQYSYAVFAHNVTPLYAPAATVTVTTALGQVTGLSAVPASTSVGLSWTNPAGDLSGVMIRRSAGSTPPASPTDGDEVVDVGVPATSVTDTSLTPGAQYAYALFAHDGAPLYANATTIVTTTISGPVTGVAAIPGSTTMVLSWTNPPAASLTGVMVRRLAGDNPPASAILGALVGDVAAPGTTVTDTGLAPDVEYSYALFAHDGTPLYSDSATLPSARTLPGPVTAVTAVPTTTSVALSWTNPTEASLSGLVIRRSTGSTPPAVPTDGVEVYVGSPVSSFTDISLTPGDTYSYSLFAHDGRPLLFTTAASVTVTTISGPVTGVAAVPGSTSIELSWTNPPAASLTGVMIRRLEGATPPGSTTDGVLVDDVVANGTTGTKTDTGLSPGSQYSYALFAHDVASQHSASATLTSPTTTGPVTAVVATPGDTSIALTWTNPDAPSLTGVTIRRQEGAIPPDSPTAGDFGVELAAPASSSYTDTTVSAETRYSYALFAHDGNLLYDTSATVATGTRIRASAVTTGTSHSCVRTSGGGVQCWGSNAFGRLGNGNTESSSVPVNVSGLGVSSNTLAVSAGDRHTCAVAGGGVQCWGRNAYGALGNNTTTDSSVPVPVPGAGSGVTAVSAGGDFSCAVTDVGGVKCWGLNDHGQLGDGSTVDRLAPVDVVGLAGVVSVSAGTSHGCAVTTSGAVRCWGVNDNGQLGDGSTTSSAVPVDVDGLSAGVVLVSAGGSHSCAVTSTAAVMCWGGNANGQLGNNSSTPSSVPVDVSGLSSGVLWVAASLAHSCAVVSGGAVKCWGENGFGQLGGESSADMLVPIAVAGFGSVAVSVTSSGYTTCAVTATGAVSCWGDNTNGDLGDGTTANSFSPVLVIGLG